MMATKYNPGDTAFIVESSRFIGNGLWRWFHYEGLDQRRPHDDHLL